jgi:hypothetical protein
MSTRIQIDVVLQRLQEQARQVLGQNREERQEREEGLPQGQQVIVEQRRADALALSESDNASASPTLTAKRRQSAERHSAVPDPYQKRRPAAQRQRTGWGLWTADWLAPERSGLVTTSDGVSRVYRYIEAKDLRFLASKQSDKPLNTPAVAGSFPQASYIYTAPTTSTSAQVGGLEFAGYNGGEFAGATFTGGSYFFTQAPVISSKDGILYGVQRHSITFTNTPWTRLISGPVSPNGVTTSYLYVYFRFDTKTGKVELRSDTAGFTAAISTVELRAPYVEGGSVWAEKYAQNAFAGDPSLELRAFGYYGDYHIRGNRASFLRLNPEGSSRFYNLYNSPFRSLWNRGQDLTWLTFELSSSGGAALKAELEGYLTDAPVAPFTETPAFTTQAELDTYTTLATAVINQILPTGGDQFWNPTGPFLYPLLPPP